MFAAFSRGDLEGPLALIARDFVVHDRMVVEDTTAARGPEAMRQNLARIGDAFDRVTFDPVEFVHQGDLVAIRVAVTARGASTGLELDAEVGQLWTLRGGEAIRLDVFPTWAEARRAAEPEA